MNKAFIFDMDGVIINSENVWKKYEKIFLADFFGENIYSKIKDQIPGNSISVIFDIAKKYGKRFDRDRFIKLYDSYAEIVYKESNITKNITNLIDELTSLDFKLGLVTSSRQYWIDLVLKKLNKNNAFQSILSLDNGKNILPKPSPDGYLKTIKELNSIPELTIILEDSSRGVQAAKASGAFTICLKENLPKDYCPEVADLYVDNINEVINQIGELIS